MKKINSVDCAKKSSPTKSQESMLTPERTVTHEHDLVQKLLVTGAPTDQTGICCQSDRCAASAA
jgi:hypothetical protein